MSTNDISTISSASIRNQYDKKTQQWYFSVIDVIAIASESSDPRNYWKVLKSRLQKVNPQLVTACNQLKLPSSDGKSYSTDVATSEVLLEIIAGISPSDVRGFRLWFEKIESTDHPQNSFPQLESIHGETELPIDMYQRGEVLVIESLIAGIHTEDIMIRATYKDLTISGLRKVPLLLQKEHTITQELFYGRFSRNITFPTPIEIENIEAHLSHGLLSIVIPLTDTKRVRMIKIKLS